MKIAITGHTRGIGKAIADTVQSRGHEVVGYSRSNGYELPQAVDTVVQHTLATDCDIFINNAYHEGSNVQVDLLFKLFYAWRGQNKRIISIGSRRAEVDVVDKPSRYGVDKNALDAACVQLNLQHDQRPLISIVHPALVDTDMVKHHTNRPKLQPQAVADAVMWILDQPPMVHVSRISLQHRRFG